MVKISLQINSNNRCSIIKRDQPVGAENTSERAIPASHRTAAWPCLSRAYTLAIKSVPFYPCVAIKFKSTEDQIGLVSGRFGSCRRDKQEFLALKLAYVAAFVIECHRDQIKRHNNPAGCKPLNL